MHSSRDAYHPLVARISQGVHLLLGGVLGPGGCTWSQGCTWSGGVYLVQGGVPGSRGVYLVLGGCTWSQGGCTWSQGGVPGPRYPLCDLNDKRGVKILPGPKLRWRAVPETGINISKFHLWTAMYRTRVKT